jgi:hypothetical protein
MSDVAARPAFSGFTDKARRPTQAALRKILARAQAAWDDLEGHLAEAYHFSGQVHWMYGERFGWALRFRRGGRFVTALYPNRGRFTAQVVLGRSQVEAASAMALPASVAKVLAAAKDYPEGRWLFVPVRTLKGARDLRPLIALKLSRPRKTGPR